MSDPTPEGATLPDEPARAGVRGTRRRSARHRRSRQLVYLVAGLAAVGAVLADGAPTGLVVADAGYRAIFAVGVTVAGARSRRWSWFLATGIAGAAATDEVLPLVLAVAGLVVAFASLRQHRRRREVGAVVGALAAQSLLRLPTELAFGVPTLVAAVAPVPMVVSALRRERWLRRYRWQLGVAAGILVVIGAAFALAMLAVEDRASDGVASAQAGLRAASAGDDAAAETAFADAEDSFSSATDIADAWWLTPARAVPVLAPHIDAVDAVGRQGQALAALSTDQVSTLRVGELTTDDGRFDLGRIGELQPVAARVTEALGRASAVLDGVDSTWLLPAATDRIDAFAEEIASVAPAARNAADALEVAPALLGAEGPQRYLVLIGNPAESRELGGFVTAAGLLRTEAGQLDFDTFAGIAQLNDTLRDAGVSFEGELPAPLPAARPDRWVQNWTDTADFATVTALAEQFGPTLVGEPVDGVVYLDPYVVSALLEITGPVAIEGRADRLGSAQAVDYLLREQYESASDDPERKDRLLDAAKSAFDDLTSRSLPDPRELADTLSPLVRARRLLFSTTDGTADDLLARVGLAPPLDTGADEVVLVAQENLRANKLDAYLERSIDYEVDVAGDGTARATLTVALTNTVPEGLDPIVTGDGANFTRTVEPLPEGLNRVDLAVYSALEPTAVTVAGEESGSARNRIDRLTRTSVVVDVPAGETVEVVVELAGQVSPGDFSLDVLPVATAGVDTLTASATAGGQTVDVETELDDTVRLEP